MRIPASRRRSRWTACAIASSGRRSGGSTTPGATATSSAPARRSARSRASVFEASQRAREVGAGGGVVALVEEVGEEDAQLADQAVEERAATGAVEVRRHV